MHDLSPQAGTEIGAGRRDTERHDTISTMGTSIAVAIIAPRRGVSTSVRITPSTNAILNTTAK